MTTQWKNRRSRLSERKGKTLETPALSNPQITPSLASDVVEKDGLLVFRSGDDWDWEAAIEEDREARLASLVETAQ